jgi:predicted Abi (CAAX) family protease
VAILRGIMPYSVRNLPMTESRWLASFWRWIDRLRLQNPQNLLGLAIDIRNMTIVAVSADRRYGPIYNQGTAHVICDSLVANGYKMGSSAPVTLLGFSGGGQISMGALPYLKRALQAPIEVISLGGVFSGNHQFLQAEHIYHLVGDRDMVERIGPVAFPRRWGLAFLSYWNRAKRRGKLSIISLGPVGHELPGGILDVEAKLPDGRTHMDQTVDLVAEILTGQRTAMPMPRQQLNNYERYQANEWHRLVIARDTHPLPNDSFRSLSPWLGRLILPSQGDRATGVKFEVFHAPDERADLVGQKLRLDWPNPMLAVVNMDVHFSEETLYSLRQGIVHPTRLNHWRQVTPLESLAGSRSRDDLLVVLQEPVVVETDKSPVRLEIAAEPVQTTGVALALVQFREALGGDRWQAVHFDLGSRQFVGPKVTLRLPEPLANGEGILPATSRDIDRVPLNSTGWYVSGVPDGVGAFVVQSIAPRALQRLQPERIITGSRAAWRYVKHEAWREAMPGTVRSVLVSGRSLSSEELLAEWQVGDLLLVVHVFGGIGGEQREQAAQTGLFFGHFAYDMAEVVREPLADELSLAIQYRQVYTHNPDGIVAATQDWWRYMGDRQVGWLGTRPVADILLRFPPFTSSYTVQEEQRSPLTVFNRQLEAMMARYRVGDGTGATYVGPANNCAQDSNQALYAAIQQLVAQIGATDREAFQAWEQRYPEQAQRLQMLIQLEQSLRRELLPLGNPRVDWQKNAYLLGSSLEDRPLRNLVRGLGSWRTMLPRLASDTVVKVFLAHGASALVLRTNQVGGYRTEIEPVVPMTL